MTIQIEENKHQQWPIEANVENLFMAWLVCANLTISCVEEYTLLDY
jgi:hypothetical protein